ncbi:Hydrogenase expression/formation protein HypC [uncultured Desulfobacterium sp.]|uniref:Hydrogenase expression/formation protein HypC n=1 Tax=uncultured Desulfobacterium sp. TaxID=201089 RepID=A0A445MU77_9BACT|nr:Hydrogenase expression/formation protein HypC [uncultured Desulfobacterium sp.]
MCLAVPSKIIQVDDKMATIDIDGVRRNASLMLLDEVKVGDFVIVHAGFAIHKIDEESALESLRILREAALLMG